MDWSFKHCAGNTLEFSKLLASSQSKLLINAIIDQEECHPIQTGTNSNWFNLITGASELQAIAAALSRLTLPVLWKINPLDLPEGLTFGELHLGANIKVGARYCNLETHISDEIATCKQGPERQTLQQPFSPSRGPSSPSGNYIAQPAVRCSEGVAAHEQRAVGPSATLVMVKRAAVMVERHHDTMHVAEDAWGHYPCQTQPSWGSELAHLDHL